MILVLQAVFQSIRQFLVIELVEYPQDSLQFRFRLHSGFGEQQNGSIAAGAPGNRFSVRPLQVVGNVIHRFREVRDRFVLQGLGAAHVTHKQAGAAGEQQVFLVGFAGDGEILVNQAFLMQPLVEFHGVHIPFGHEFRSQLPVYQPPVIGSAEHSGNGFEGAVYQIIAVCQRNGPAPAGQIGLLKLLQHLINFFRRGGHLHPHLVQPVLTVDQTGTGRLPFLVEGIDLAVHFGVTQNLGVQFTQVRIILEVRSNLPELPVLNGRSHQDKRGCILNKSGLRQGAG
ncbi:hypothetical protein D3C75_730020 [compost metagenome]